MHELSDVDPALLWEANAPAVQRFALAVIDGQPLGRELPYAFSCWR
jgi:hypothetical protein